MQETISVSEFKATWIGKYEDVIKIPRDIIAPAIDEIEWDAMK